MTGRSAPIAVWFLLFLLAGCAESRESVPRCDEGSSVRCVCPSGGLGAQQCAGGAFAACQCGVEAPACAPGSLAPCACTDGDSGTQQCNAAGFYGTCRCEDEPVGPPSCVPGSTSRCICATGETGSQICEPDGVFGACVCEPLPERCVPGASAACVCSDGSSGAQVCGGDGAFGPCVCEGLMPARDAGFELDGSFDGERDAGRDAAPRDAGPLDAGPCGSCETLGVRCGSAIDACGEVRSCGVCSGTTRSLALEVRDIVYDATRDRVYASVAGSAGVRGNSIVAIDPATATVAWSTFVGSEPGPIALSPDASRLWIGLSGAYAIRSLDLATRVAGPEQTLGQSDHGDRLRAGALVMLSSGALAVSHFEGMGSYFRSVGIYDEGVRRSAVSMYGARGGDSIVAIGPSTIVGYNSGDTGFDVTRYEIDASGVSGYENHRDLIEGFNAAISWDGEYVISSNGAAVDPTTMSRVGQCTPSGSTSSSSLSIHAGAGEAATNRLYFALGGTFSSDPLVGIIACDRTTFTETARLPLTALEGRVSEMLLRGQQGFVLLVPGDRFDETDTRVVFVDTNLVAVTP